MVALKLVKGSGPKIAEKTGIEAKADSPDMRDLRLRGKLEDAWQDLFPGRSLPANLPIRSPNEAARQEAFEIQLGLRPSRADSSAVSSTDLLRGLRKGLSETAVPPESPEKPRLRLVPPTPKFTESN